METDEDKVRMGTRQQGQDGDGDTTTRTRRGLGHDNESMTMRGDKRMGTTRAKPMPAMTTMTIASPLPPQPPQPSLTTSCMHMQDCSNNTCTQPPPPSHHPHLPSHTHATTTHTCLLTRMRPSPTPALSHICMHTPHLFIIVVVHYLTCTVYSEYIDSTT